MKSKDNLWPEGKELRKLAIFNSWKMKLQQIEQQTEQIREEDVTEQNQQEDIIEQNEQPQYQERVAEQPQDQVDELYQLDIQEQDYPEIADLDNVAAYFDYNANYYCAGACINTEKMFESRI